MNSVRSPALTPALAPTAPAQYHRAAANDDAAATPPNDLRNPLWIIAIGMAFFFGGAAAVMAFL